MHERGTATPFRGCPLPCTRALRYLFSASASANRQNRRDAHSTFTHKLPLTPHLQKHWMRLSCSESAAAVLQPFALSLASKDSRKATNPDARRSARQGLPFFLFPFVPRSMHRTKRQKGKRKKGTAVQGLSPFLSGLSQTVPSAVVSAS